MKSLLILFFIAVCIDSHAQFEAPERTLARMEDVRLKAVIGRDSMALVAMYDDQYRGILTNGRQVKKAGVIEFQLTTNPNIKISIENVEATIHGDVGIVTGKQVNKSKSGTVLGQSKFIRVYKKTNSAWKIIYSQGTLTAEDL